MCPVKTWTEVHPAIAPRACLTEQAQAWAFEQAGRCDVAVSRVAAELGVAWWTIMNLTLERGTPIIARLTPTLGRNGAGSARPAIARSRIGEAVGSTSVPHRA